MADKQCYVYIVDIGKSMSLKHSGRQESDLDFGMRYIWDKIAVTMAAARKTFTLGVIGLKTDGSDNHLAEKDDSYAHMSLLQPIGPFDMTDFRALHEKITPSRTVQGDAVSSIILAIDLIEGFAKKLKYHRKIVLMTDGRSNVDADGMEAVWEKLNEDDIELVVVGIDFDDAEYGYKEEDKDQIKLDNEGLLRTLTENCKRGTFGTMAEAVEGLAVPVVKASKPYCNYKGTLTLGDPEVYDTAMSIDVERYFRTKKAAPISASTFAASNGAGSVQAPPAGEDIAIDGAGSSSNDLSAVRYARGYVVEDASAPGGKRNVERDDLARGFQYGRTAVHISESDENVTKLETSMGFSIIGFVPRQSYACYFNMGESHIIIAQKTNDKARLALSSFIHALHELETCAVARLVKKPGKDPELVLLFPSIEPDLESLIDIPLPFAEDVRTYRFPPLDRVITISNTVLTKHRNIPTDELSASMSDFVDSMDLSTFGKDEDGNAVEYMQIEETYAPTVHRLQAAVRRRAIKPAEPVQAPSEILLRYSQPPEKLVKAAKSSLDALIKRADVKKVPTKSKGRKKRDYVKPLSGLDIDALLNTSGRKKVKISPENAVPEYKQLLQDAEEEKAIRDITDQMARITRNFIQESTGDSRYDQALANVSVMREQLLELEAPEVYNSFLQDLKEKILDEQLGGERREFLWRIRKERLGLITSTESEFAHVGQEEVGAFYSLKKTLPVRGKEEH